MSSMLIVCDQKYRLIGKPCVPEEQRCAFLGKTLSAAMQPRLGRRVVRKQTPVTMPILMSVLNNQGERKFVYRDLSTLYATISTGWNEHDIGNIGQGITVATRIGRKARLTTLEIRAVLAGGASDTVVDDAYNVIRVFLGLWTNVSSTPLATVSASANAYIARENDTLGRLIKMYYDRYICLPVQCPGIASGYAPGLKKLVLTIPINQTITYGTDAADRADKLLILSMTSDSTTTPSPGIVNGYSVCHFQDD